MKKTVVILLTVLCVQRAAVASLEELRAGCVLATTEYPDAQKKLPPDEKQQMELFLQFMESGKGAELLPMVLADEPVADEDQPYMPMVKAFVYTLGKYGQRLPFYERFATQGDALKTAYKNAEVQGIAALRKGYLHQPLTDDDMQALRDYAILINITHTGAKLLPFHIGLSKPFPANRMNFFQTGEPTPDFCLRTLEDALHSPDYSDVRVSDPTAFLKPEAVEELTRLFEQYRPAADGRQVTHDVPEEKKGLLKLSSFRGKKPVLLILADPVDCYFPQVQAMLEPLKRACGDRVQFLFVHVTIHDAGMNPLEYFGPLKGGKAMSLHPESEEQRARTAKLFYMRYPNVTVPCVLDNDSQTTRNDWGAEGGDARMTLVNLDGKIACDMPCGWYYWTKGNYSGETMHVNTIERELLALLNNGGLTDPAREPFRRDGEKFAPPEPGGPERDAPDYGYNRHLWFCGKIESVDTEDGTVTAVRFAPPAGELPGLQFIRQAGDAAGLDEQTALNFQTLGKWIAEGSATRTFVLNETDALFLNGRVTTVDKLQPGDVIGAYYDLNKDGSGTIVPEQFRATRID